jgi:SAM-dependent methyltransferase
MGKSFAESGNLQNIEWRVADIQALPWPDNSFDTAISCETIEHVPSPRTAVRELARVLRPGGKLFLTVPNYFSMLGVHRLYREFFRNQRFQERPRDVIENGDIGIQPEENVRLAPDRGIENGETLVTEANRVPAIADALFLESDYREAGDREVVTILLAHKADVNHREKKAGGTALHFAISEGHVFLMGDLLKAGADPNAKTDKGLTPLVMALHKQDSQMVMWLLNHKADPNLESSEGTPLVVATRLNDRANASVLRSKGAKR